MALPRKDIRAKLDADVHDALVAVCEADQMDIGEFIEREIERVVRKRVHDAQAIASRVLAGEKQGAAGNEPFLRLQKPRAALPRPQPNRPRSANL